MNKYPIFFYFFIVFQSSASFLIGQNNLDSISVNQDEFNASTYDNLYWINDSVAYHFYPTKKFGFVTNAIDNFIHQPKELVNRENLKVL